MDQKISSKNENRDPKVLKTFEVINTLKATEPTISEVKLNVSSSFGATTN